MCLIRAESILNGAVIPGVTALPDLNGIRINDSLEAAATVDLAGIYSEL